MSTTPCPEPATRASRRATRRRRFVVGAAATALLGAALTSPSAQAVHDEGFSLTGTINGTPNDWATNIMTVDANGDGVPRSTLPAGFLDAAFEADYALPDASGYATGTKDTLPIDGGWQCKTPNNLGAKFDILNAYAAAYVPTTGTDAGDLIVYFGSEIASPNGNRNAGLWLLKDQNVACEGAGNTDFTGAHQDGDVFIVSAFTNGGASANIDVYRWNGDDATGGLALSDSFTNAVCGPALSDDSACAIANTNGDKKYDASYEIDPPWNAPDADGGNLNEAEFIEGGLNLTDLGLQGCFSTFVANSRSSQELGSTLHDFASGQFNTCGSLNVSKFVDYDGDGIQDVGDGPGDWTFNVTGPAPSTNVVCSGPTGPDGILECGTVPSGTYTVTETQVTDYYNTKAGTTVAVNGSGTVSTTVTVGLGGAASVSFGNICYVDKLLQVTGVPTGANAPASITAQYKINNAATFTNLPLTNNGGGAWSATVNNLLQTDLVDWQYYIGTQSTHVRLVDDDESMQSGNPTSPNGPDRTAGCSVTNTDTYPSATLTGLKYKDMTANGTKDGADPGLGGFDFALKIGSTSLGTATSSSVEATKGQYSFTGVYPGTYTVEETDKAHWYQTEPAGNANRTVTVYLDDTSVAIGNFGNTPLSDIAVTFSDNGTGATNSTISCTGPTQPTGAGGSLQPAQTDGTYAGDEVIVGTYTCTVVIVDP
ncbi:SdrD B-like domain-containing protein [Ornithinimicrobium cerasi]|uniref:SD-repeat containing protein B domain-containing protein n=1 Tax=Ornithinimicrobium cerasi TaxID=2248773 RepID=A0A285VFW9_9MICO|nr:SdrD B-like domain-containing protein [Ornithinimicrobium cerasi]SOC51441.1 hypothetical protein SAMN05421879_101195 [Ornithinimicrobium cerasi]